MRVECVDVHITLGGRGDLAAQIYRQLLDAILDGRLRVGERLPASRVLAGAARGLTQHRGGRLRPPGRRGIPVRPGRRRHVHQRTDRRGAPRPAWPCRARPGPAHGRHSAASSVGGAAARRHRARGGAGVRLQRRRARPVAVPVRDLAASDRPRASASADRPADYSRARRPRGSARGDRPPLRRLPRRARQRRRRARHARRAAGTGPHWPGADRARQLRRGRGTRVPAGAASLPVTGCPGRRRPC